jgi:hypothetical protein
MISKAARQQQGGSKSSGARSVEKSLIPTAASSATETGCYRDVSSVQHSVKVSPVLLLCTAPSRCHPAQAQALAAYSSTPSTMQCWLISSCHTLLLCLSARTTKYSQADEAPAAY